MTQAQESQFRIEAEPYYKGYTFGTLWNGWDCPHFTKEVVEEFAKTWANVDECRMVFVGTDLHIIMEGEVDVLKLEAINTDKGPVEAYNFGLLGWVWEDVRNFN